MASSNSNLSKYKLIPEVAKNEVGWTAKVVVAEKTSPQQSTRSPTKYQSLLLVDPKGNKVRACIFNANIAAFQSKLQLNKTYLISNAYVKEVKAEFRQRPNELEWTIDARTIIQEVNENHGDVLDSAYKFTPFDQLQLHVDRPIDINILAPIIDIRPRRKIQSKSGNTSTIQEVVLVDQQFQTLLMTMWDAFVDNECATISNIIHRKPIIAALRLRAVSHNGYIHMQTKAVSCFIIDPQIASAKLLRTWVTENSTKLNEIADNKKLFISAIRLQLPPIDYIVAIGDINDMLMTRTTFWVKALVSVNNYNQPFCYIACDKCHKATGRETGAIFECVFCNTSQAKAIPWLRIELNVHDSTGAVSATVFGEVAEKLFSCTATDFMKLSPKDDDQSSLQAFFNGSTQEERIIYLKSPKNDAAYFETTKFVIVFASKTTTDQLRVQSIANQPTPQLQTQNTELLPTAPPMQSDSVVESMQQIETVQEDKDEPAAKRQKSHQDSHA